MRTDDFDYSLPDDAIAQRPAPRGTSRLLVLDEPPDSTARHRRVADLPELLRAGDLLVVNDTRVVPARLFGRRPGGGRAELLLLEKTAPREWQALARPAKRLRPGVRVTIDDAPATAEILGRDGEMTRLRFDVEIEPHLDTAGHVPLPPYIQRADDAADRTTYQTVFARHDGAVAAPTAGLHFDDVLLERLAAAGVERASVTLHVGPGTFRPVTADEVAEHRMDAERYDVPAATAAAIEATRRRGGRIVAVGTTVVRTLEAAARAARGTSGEGVAAGAGRTELFLKPGDDFLVVDLLLTNFHLPRSTLLMLVSALAGRERVLTAYGEAVERGYRFYSYGDAMLVSGRR
ncbi:MAG: tRNA preQ1(34) S-adenosylmethionine ribosyltransferase-isomerase QueA [Acidobacteriota bacterium]